MQFVLKNSMRDRQYSYPESVVTFGVSFAEEAYLPPYVAQCEGEVRPVQLSSLQMENGRVICAKASFVTALECGQTKHFVCKHAQEREDRPIASISADAVVLDNGKLSVICEYGTRSLFTIRAGECVGTSQIDREILKKTVEILENDPVFAEVRITAYFSETEKYTQTLRLNACDEYVILDETMQALSDCNMLLHWHGLEPSYRIQKYSGTESRRVAGRFYRADEYTEADGLLSQVRLTPYDETSGAAGTQFLSFVGERLAAGVFTADSHRWWDGEYAIDGYRNLNLPTFYCYYENANCHLTFRFPLNSGTRQCGITIYPAEKEPNEENLFYIEKMRFHAAVAPLDVFKDWVLEWKQEKNGFPRFFDKAWIKPDVRYGFRYDAKGLPTAQEMEQEIKNSTLYRYPHKAGGCFTRVFEHWIPAFDLLADEMSEEQFSYWCAIFAYFAYLCSREECFPVDRMLGGHPNFLLDVKNIVGMCAAFFPEHPHAQMWKQHYEKSVQLVLKYHVRPQVDAWGALGGRYTESYGTYLWGSMKHASEASMLLTFQYGDDPLLCAGLVELAKWICDIVTPPIAGRRTIPYAGAHAGCHEQNPFYPLWNVRLLGLALREYEPTVSRQLLALCPPEPRIGHEMYCDHIDVDIWSELMRKIPNWDACETELPRCSQKYTGYGYILRANVGEQDEMMISLQQLDEGLNYRWGRAAWGGCGNIQYYADGKVYSGVRKEDFGDDNFSDDAVGCNFCVLMEHTYKSVGQNDAVYPLVDHGFLQYTRIDAGAYSNAEYCYRSVMMVGGRYIAIYDAVQRERTQGKFTWHSYSEDTFPHIFQLRPGVTPRKVAGAAYTVDGRPRYPAVREDRDVIGQVYDGFGDFLTVVTHKDGISAEVTPFGAIVREGERCDYIFQANCYQRYEENAVAFAGKVGFASITKQGVSISLIDGTYLRAGQIELRRVTGEGSISLTSTERGLRGYVSAPAPVRVQITAPNACVYQNGTKLADEGGCLLAEGEFYVSDERPVSTVVSNLRYVEEQNGFSPIFTQTDDADAYEIRVEEADGTSRIEPCASGKCVEMQGSYASIAVRAVGAGGYGAWSVPIPITRKQMSSTRVEGLRVCLHPEYTQISWGKKDGISHYCLYRENAEGITCIYRGIQTHYHDRKNGFCRYYVTCVNGYGESAPSIVRDTSEDGMATFDPMPDIRYVRDTIVNLHGYGGFDYQYNENRRILSYPQNHTEK